MSLPYSDPSNPALPSPLFSDLTAVRADHMRANNSAIWGDLQNLDGRADRVESLVPTASGSTLTLTVNSKRTQQITGASTEIVVLPVVTTLYLGFDFEIINSSSGNVTVNSSGGNLVATIYAGGTLIVKCVAITGTTAASWATRYISGLVPDTAATALTLAERDAAGCLFTAAPTVDEHASTKKYVDDFIASLILIGNGSTVFKTASYVITDDDGVSVLEFDTTAGDLTCTLPLKANNRGRVLTIKHIKGVNKLIIASNASDANTLTNDAMSVMWLPQIDDMLKVKESVNSGFWEVLSERISCQLRLQVGAGAGSTDTKILRFTNSLQNFGNMFSENHSTGYAGNTQGLEIKIQRSGIYSCCLTYGAASGISTGLSLNSNQLSTAFESITVTDKLALINVTPTGTSVWGQAIYTGYLAKNDIIRPHGLGYMYDNYGFSAFVACYLGKG